MLWVILSLLTALAVATHDAWVKRHFSALSPAEMLTFPMIYSFPLFLATSLLVPAPPLDRVFFLAFLASLPINAVSMKLYMKAIKTSPLSMTLPYLAVTPTFTILTGHLFLDELPGPWGAAGILATCAGSYVLNIEPGKNALSDPLKAVFRETGSWLMLIVSFL